MKKIITIVSVLFGLFLIGCTPQTNPNKYQVTFKGLNDTIISTIEVEANQVVSYPVVPSETGHNFVGWDQTVTTITKDTIISAIYQKKVYTVKFYDINNQLLETKEVEYDSQVVAPTAPIVVGYDFLGWNQELENVCKNLNVKALYKQKEYTVTFYDADGNILEEQIVKHGESASKPADPTKDGCLFLEWDQEFSNVTTNLDIKPIFEENVCLVEFVDMYGEVISSQKVGVNMSAVAPDIPNVAYHSFIGWDQEFDRVTSNMTIKALYKKDEATFVKTDVNYWLKQLSLSSNINKELLTRAEINDYNDKITSSYSSTKVMDVCMISKTQTSMYVKSLINKYTNINKYNVYHENSKSVLSSSDKETILANRNLDNILETVNVKFGIVTTQTWVRSYPTNHYSNDYDMDRFQETALIIGEGVAIYHTSLDGNWYFVQAENYNGWVEAKNIGLCSQEEMVSFVKPENRLLVISNYVMIEDQCARMSAAFPLLSELETTYQIAFPKRTNEGSLELIDLEVAKSSDYSIGYLEYTYENVFKQAFKLLGIDYSWGDKTMAGRDCSSTMNAIYKCFGFMMPRNTSNQVAIPGYGKKLSGINNTAIQEYCPGTMIFTSSHVMLYIGTDENGTAYLLHNTNAGNGECILQSLNGYGPSKINGVLELQ